MDEIDEQIKTMQFLQCFDKETQSLIVRLRQRYKDKPKEPASIVADVVGTICARLIVGTTPVNFWQPMMMAIAKALAKEKEKEAGV